MTGPYNKKSEGSLHRLSFFKILFVAINTAFGNLTNTAGCTRCEITVVTQNDGSSD